MIRNLIYLLILIIENNNAEFFPQFRPFNPLIQPQLPKCPLHMTMHSHRQHELPPPMQANINITTTKSEIPHDAMKFLVPFLDMEISKDHIAHVMQVKEKQEIFILHGSEFYQLILSRKEKRLSLMARLEGSIAATEALGAEIIYWKGYYLLVIALEEYLEVYQISEEILKKRSELLKNPSMALNQPPPKFDAIQQLSLTGKYQKLFLFPTADERIMIIAAVNFTKLYGKFRTFEWLRTYFNPIEEIAVPAITVANVIGTKNKFLIAGRAIRHQSKTILTNYEITKPTLQLRPIQTLTVQSKVVHIYTYQQRHLIIACSSKKEKCNSFRRSADGQFNVYKQRNAKDYTFQMLHAGQRFIIGARQNEIMAFTNYRLDCYGSFISDQPEVSQLMTYYNAEMKEDYIVLIYKRPFKMLLRIVEVEMDVKNDFLDTPQADVEEISPAKHHLQLFETTTNKLRSLLLGRKIHMDILRRVPGILNPQPKQFFVKNPINLHSGNVGIIKVIGKNLKSPQEILYHVNAMRQKYLPQLQRGPRSVDEGPFNITLNLPNRLNVHKLKVKNLLYDKDDLLKGFKFNRSARPLPLLTITEKIQTHKLNCSDIITAKNLRFARQYIPDLFFDLTPSIYVKHLRVESINNVPWQKWLQTVFLRNRDRAIKGRLVLQASAIIDHLNTTTLNDMAVAKLFNLRDPQEIESDLVISRFFVSNLQADNINGLKFHDDIVFQYQDVFIETPVIMNHLSIIGDLILNENKFNRFNTDDLEFKQIYTKKVIINGTLTLNNLQRERGNITRIQVGNETFDESQLREKYLLKQQEQNFKFPIIFDNSKVSVPSLQTNYLNDYATGEHMLTNGINSSRPIQIVFMKVHAKKNIICQDYKSKLAELKENLITPNGTANITGIKRFENSVEVAELIAENANSLSLDELVKKSDFELVLKFSGLKHFNRILIENSAFIAKDLNAMHLNNLPLEELLNQDYHMERLYVPHDIRAVNIVFHKLNGIPFEKIFANLKLKDDKLILHKDLIVEGNVLFNEPLELEHINNLEWNSYLDGLVHLNENAVIEGPVIFYEDVQITRQLELNKINNVHVQSMLQNILRKSKAQIITGRYTFDCMKVGNLDVPMLNKQFTKEFLDLSVDHVEIQGDLILQDKLHIAGNLTGTLVNLESAENFKEKIDNLLRKPVRNLMVLENANWNASAAEGDYTNYELLKYLYKNSVKNNANQVISGNVRLTKPLISRMITKTKFPKNIDLDFINSDALLRNAAVMQEITGDNQFIKTLYANSMEVELAGNLKTKILNNVDIERFNLSLYRLSSRQPINANLKFLKPLNIGNLQVHGLLNYIDTKSIFQFKNSSALEMPVRFHQLFIEEELKIDRLNEMSLDYFFDNRITLRGDALEIFGFLTFENLVIEKDSLMQSINGIALENLVFKHSRTLQTITGHKAVKDYIQLAGPSHIMNLNDRDLLEMKRKALKTNLNYQFENLLIDEITLEKGINVLSNLNAAKKSQQFRSFEEIDADFQGKRHQLKQLIEEFQLQLAEKQNPLRFFDYQRNITIKWKQPAENRTLKQIISHEVERISCCEKKFIQLEMDESSNTLLLSYKQSNLMTLLGTNLAVKAENYCKLKYRKIKSKITITTKNLLKVFGMKRFIETIQVIEEQSAKPFVILHALDYPTEKRNEIRILKVDKENHTVNDWQALIQNVGNKMKVFEFKSHAMLLTNAIMDKQPSLLIYGFNHTAEKFKLQQIIEGDFDIMEMLEFSRAVSSEQQMILTCKTCKRIFIYNRIAAKAHQQSPSSFDLFQIIKLEKFIESVFTFHIQSDHYMLVICSQQSSYYHLYKYSHLQGWLHAAHGYYPSMQVAIPLSNQNLFKNSLLLLCNFVRCNVLNYF